MLDEGIAAGPGRGTAADEERRNHSVCSGGCQLSTGGGVRAMGSIRRHTLGLADEIGDENAPIDSRPWCKWLYRKAVSLKHDAETTAVFLKDYLTSLRDRERWRRLDDRDGRAFTSWEDFCQYPEPFGLGMSMQQVAAILEEPDGAQDVIGQFTALWRTASAQERATIRRLVAGARP